MRTNTALSLLQQIVGDGFLSESNAARARELISVAAGDGSTAPPGAWRDELIGLRYIDGVGWRPAPRNHPDAVYVADEVHRVLAPLLDQDVKCRPQE